MNKLKKFYSPIVASLLVFVLVFSIASIAKATSPINPDTNHVEYWENLGYGICSKVENPGGTTYTLPNPSSGTIWSLLVIKAGSAESNPSGLDYEQYNDPVPGVAYSAPLNQQNEPREISHVIFCSKSDTTPTPTPSHSCSPTPTPTPSHSCTPTPTPSNSVTPTPTPTPSGGTSPTPTPSISATPTATPTPGTSVTLTPQVLGTSTVAGVGGENLPVSGANDVSIYYLYIVGSLGLAYYFKRNTWAKK